MGFAGPSGWSLNGPGEVERLQSKRSAIAHADASADRDRLRPIFLHGLWRSGSTYVWSRFRAADGTLCYYEPLHDGLRRLTHARIQRDTPAAAQNNHHPAMEQPYFAEFGALLNGRGVRGYRRRFAYDAFAPARSHNDPALEAYVQGLIDRARGQNRSAVLGFNRTGLRVGWLSDRFDAYNIHIDRDPIDIFASYLSQLQAGNTYYFVKWMQIIGGNPGYPPFACALSKFRRAGVVESLVPGPMRYYRGLAAGLSMEALYSITFLAWAVCVLHALETCDLIIDIALADRSGYCEAISQAVRDQTGLEASFDEMHAPAIPSPLRLAHQHAIEQEVLGWLVEPGAEGLFDRAAIRGRLDDLSPRRAHLLADVL